VRKDNSVIFRVRRRGLGGRITKKEWLDMKESCNFTCKKCKKKEPEIKLVADHIVPVVRWEEWIKKNTVNYMCGDKENIQPLCISCNCKKSSKLEDEVLEQLGYKHE
jgi:5-methylcytosine-specific restriction endonuclease McrA